MTSHVKDSFSNINTWTSRAGVVVGYKPEDTMKSFLFNQNNRHCINLCQDDTISQKTIVKALEFLSSDSESESSSMTKITVKNISSLLTNNSLITEEKINSVKSSKSVTDLEMYNKNDNSDTDCTSADFSNEFEDVHYLDDRKLTNGLPNKSFEEILEDKLKYEDNIVIPQRGNCKSEPPGLKPKFVFLKKNTGKAAWCSNIRPERSRLSDKTSSKVRSQSNDKEIRKRSQPVESNYNYRHPVHLQQSQHLNQQPNVKLKSTTKTNKLEKRSQKSYSKTVHFAASCTNGSDVDQKYDEPALKTQITQKVAEIEDKTRTCLNESQDLDKELVEFELLEQIANVSTSSSIVSSIAMYDEEDLREKLKSFKSMPPPISCIQNKFSDILNNQSGESKNVFNNNERFYQQLSTCEEKTEVVQSTNECDTDVDENDDCDSQNTSINTTTLSEFQESISCKAINAQVNNPKTQAFSRKISKQNERIKLSDNQSEEWIDENPFKRENCEKSNDLPKKILATIPNVDWTFADPFPQSESSDDEEIDFSTKNKHQLNENFEIPSIYPVVAVDKKQSNQEDNMNMQSAKLKQWVQILENEMKKFRSENEEIDKLKKEKEEGLKRLEEEMKAFKKYKEEDTKKFEEYKQSEIKKLKKEKKVFDDYQEAMKNMPNKKDRLEIDNLKSEIEMLREESLNKENRWQAANTRLKQKVDQLESENAELHSRIHALEQKRLQLQAQLVSTVSQKSKLEINPSKPKQTVTSVSQAVSMKHSNIPIGSVTKDDNNNNKCTPVIAKTTIPLKKNNIKPSCNNNVTKLQKPIKIVAKNFSPENETIDIRGSAASDYYTGEDESGSVDMNLNNRPRTNSTGLPGNSYVASPNVPNSHSLKTDRSNEVIKDEVHHPDGIIERVYMDGSVDVVYPNGSLKQISADGKSVSVHLFNGDVKQITPDGRVVYFYAQDESTQITYLNGTEEIFYKNGHKEVLHPSGIREITFPDKSVKILHPDSREETFLSNGLVIRINNTGDKEILLPNGQKEIHSNGLKKRIYPDGTTKTVYSDGRQETFYASGRMRVKDKSGNLILDQYISKTNP